MSDPYEDICSDFIKVIEDATDEEFLDSGVTISTPKWDVLLVPSESELINSSIPQLKEPLITLFSSRRDLFNPVIDSRNEAELLNSLSGLYQWLSLRGYEVKFRGNTFITRFKFNFYRGMSRVIGWAFN